MKIRTFLTSIAMTTAIAASPAFAGEGKASQIGDMVYKSSGWDSLFAGHSGILYTKGANRTVADVTDGSTRTKYHKLSVARPVSNFEDSADYMGARRMAGQWAHGLTPSQQIALKARIDYFNTYNVEYDSNHLDQKGTWFPHNYFWQDSSHWEFDCVGFMERVMEDIGLNPTDNSFESGWGWPLTVYEQKNSSRLVHAPFTLVRTVKSCATKLPIGATQQVSLLTGAYTNYTCASRYKEQCIDDGTFDNYYDETCTD